MSEAQLAQDDLRMAMPRDEMGDPLPEFIDEVSMAIEELNSARARELVVPLHAADIATLIEYFDRASRRELVEMLGNEFDFQVLTEVDETIRLEILEDLNPEQVAEKVLDMNTDDAVYILEDMEDADREEILDQMSDFDSSALRRAFDYPEESAGRRMQVEFIATPPFWTVGRTIDFMRDSDDLPDQFFEVYVVDPSFKLVGVVALDKLLRAKRQMRIDDLMREPRATVLATADQEQAARKFERYDLLSAAVLDENERLVGVLTIDDIVDVIEAEADEDIKRLGGVADEEEISDSVMATTKYRFPWLFINLLTAIAASAVISLFSGTIEQIVALAVLMPIVASMGGNAGTQSLTVAVRAIATRDLNKGNTRRIVYREGVVGLLNGLAFAAIMGLVGGLWAQSWGIGLVLAAAMIINLFVAGMSGILIPVVLNKLKYDPAVASSVFVTTVTDVVGFFAFLGLAAIVLL
jgi:magnesium transporter